MNKTEPYFDEDGTLIIPFECTDHAYKYWKKEGKDMHEVLTQLRAPKEAWEKYTHVSYPGEDAIEEAIKAAAEKAAEEDIQE